MQFYDRKTATIALGTAQTGHPCCADSHWVSVNSPVLVNSVEPTFTMNFAMFLPTYLVSLQWKGLDNFSLIDDLHHARHRCLGIVLCAVLRIELHPVLY